MHLMSACFSASGAGCLFLVSHRLLVGEVDWLHMGGATAAAILSAFPFTHWQNSNETEVYAVATFSIAAISWLAVRWRDLRGTARAPHILLLIVYVAALSIGNHLLALLVGPAVSVFMLHTLRASPAADPVERQMEWAEWCALSALWIVLVAVGLGSGKVLMVGSLLLVAAVVFCVRSGSRAFLLLAIGVAAVGISVYTFLYIRSGLHPILNEAQPDQWSSLLAVIRREQFGSRGLLDNPMVPGAARTLNVFGQQFLNYFQYCSWQWARGLPFAPMVIAALVFFTLGSLGFEFTRRRDVGFVYLLGALWLVTGVGLVIYMNFKAGYSMFWDRYPTIDQHEVRERDYFFVVSFQVWGMFAAFGLVRLVRQLATRQARPFDAAHAPPAYWTLAPSSPPPGPALQLTEHDIQEMQPMELGQDGVFRAGGMELVFRKGQRLLTADQVILFTLATYLPSRPVTFGVSSGRGSWLGLDPDLVFQVLVFKVAPRADSTRRFLRGIQGPMVDTARTRMLVDSVFQWGRLFRADSLELEPAAQQVATSFATPFLELGNAAAVRGDQRRTLDYLRRAYHLNPSQALAAIIHRVETQGVQSLFSR